MSRKPYYVHDHGLWDDVARTIRPLVLRKASRPETSHKAQTTVPQGSVVMQTPGVAAAAPRRARPDIAPPIGNLERRLAQRLSRGQLEPEAKLDLHGDGLEMARVKLYHFLERQRHQGARLVLVITGKGASPFARHTLHGQSLFHSPEREGRLRRDVPLWLHENVFRNHVVGYQPAHPRHGGGGAIYVRLRSLGER